ncbi:putative mitochondrial protein [Cucumis melo var. makuwa]|uniref:Mitochondrial protein n=1 Tax=Cucumis melo var. makuwa TaxID=1194695 RepID=A0A5A7V7C7_CUCMM|nr:putative mitochondrial protein [Cucumis melo var. makuwa]
MHKAKPKRTPVATHLKMTKDINGEKVDTNLYRSIIGSLLYLIASRPDIAFAVGVCARYQVDPRTSHLHSAKRILKYVSGTFNYGIWYTFDTTGVLVGYCDADWAGCSDDRKSTSGGCFFLGNNVAAWFSKKQNSVSPSTAEAKYIAAGSSCSQPMWMKQMLEEYGMTQSSMVLYCDNLSAISISKNPVQHSRTKHIDIRHHFIRELVEANIISLEHVLSAFQLADIFTKPLDVATFEGLRNYPSGISSSSNNSSALSVSESMAPSPPKSTTSSKGKRYEGIPTKHQYKKVCRSISTGDHSTVPSPECSSHAKRSANPSSPVTIKKEVPEFSSP